MRRRAAIVDVAAAAAEASPTCTRPDISSLIEETDVSAKSAVRNKAWAELRVGDAASLEQDARCRISFVRASDIAGNIAHVHAARRIISD
jgi:hypothetical protein